MYEADMLNNEEIAKRCCYMLLECLDVFYFSKQQPGVFHRKQVTEGENEVEKIESFIKIAGEITNNCVLPFIYLFFIIITLGWGG